MITDTDAHPIKNWDNIIINYDETIKIGSYVWIGSRILILEGTKIENNCIIAVGSLLHKRYEVKKCDY